MVETKLEQVHRLFGDSHVKARLPSKLKEIRDTVDASCGSFIHTVRYMNGEYAPHFQMPAIPSRVHYKQTRHGFMCLYQWRNRLGLWFTDYIYACK